MSRLVTALAILAFGASAGAQQILNGHFETGRTAWSNHPVTTSSGWSVTNADGDADLEAVLNAQALTNAGQGILLIQDTFTDYVDLHYGVALSADVGATNLDGDIRAFLKLEFGTETSGDFGTTNVPALSLSTENDPSGFASSNTAHRQVYLVKPYRALSNELAAVGAAIDDVKWMRAVLFLLRFDNTTPSPGDGYFDRVSWGLVSRSYDVPGLPNGGFEYGPWTWNDNPITTTSGSSVYDRDGDGDLELELDAAGLTGQFSSRLFVWEADATMMDLTQDITLTADFGATNLAPDMKVFTKLEFSTNGPPNRNGSVVPGAFVSGEYDAATFATNNETRAGTALTMTHANLTNLLATAGARFEDLTFARVVLFLLQGGTNGSPAYGQGWFDNARLDFTYRDRPNVAGAQLSGDQLVVSWSSQTGRSYRVQQITNLFDYAWTNVASGVAGQAGSTAITNPLAGSAPTFLRVVRDN